MGSRRRLAQAYYDMATLLDAGVPILRSLDILIQGQRGRFKQIFSQVRQSVSKGSNLSEALGEHRRVFPELDRMLIESAETAGSVPDSFKMLSHWHEFVERITRQIQMGLLYPFFILHAAAVIYPLPDLVSSFVSGQANVGAYLRQVLQVLLVLYVPMSIVIGSMLFRDRAPALRLLIDSLILKIPGLGAAVYHLSVYRYAKAFGMLYKAGVPISECTERATRATGNAVVAQLFAGGAASVRQGGTIWEGLSKRLPAEYLHLWQIGEEAGELDKTVDRIAAAAQDRADRYFALFAQWLPRVIYFAIMGIVAYMVLRIGTQVYGGALGGF
jgi:type II secretory pathway component PulF